MSTTGRIATAALIAIAPLVAANPAFGQAAQGDDWKFVPPLVTTCFSDDGFSETLNAAQDAIQAEIAKQEEINAAAKEKFDNMDPMEMAQRMQEFLMKDPQAAMKMLQAEQAAGAAAASAVTEGNEDVQRLDAELESLKASYGAALEEAVQPVHARQDELIEAKTVPVGEVQEPMFVNAADHEQYVQLIAEENAAIEKACAPFFGANGTFPQWLESWRTDVVEKMIIAGEDTDILVMQMAAMDLPGGGYRSTTPLQQVGNYVRKIGDVYGVRPMKVNPTIGLRGS